MIIVILFALLASMGVRMAGLLLQIMFWIPAAITVVIYGMLLAVTPQALNSGIQSFTGQTPTAFTQLALSQGMDTPYAGGYWSAVPYAALGAYWAYRKLPKTCLEHCSSQTALLSYFTLPSQRWSPGLR
jgi:amino acid transporter